MNSSDSVPIGLTRSLFVVSPGVAFGHATAGPTLRFLRHRPFYRPLRPEENPLTGFSPPSEFHQRIPQSNFLHSRSKTRNATSFTLLLPRFGPLQRFASRREPPKPGKIPTHRLSCVLRVSRPLDALLPPRPAGFVPPRFRSWGLPFEVLLLLGQCRTPFRAPQPSCS